MGFPRRVIFFLPGRVFVAEKIQPVGVFFRVYGVVRKNLESFLATVCRGSTRRYQIKGILSWICPISDRDIL